MKFINSPQELAEFADEHGLRPDWHEPNEQGINAHVYGGHLDNAMGAGYLPHRHNIEELIRYNYDEKRGELNVVLDETIWHEDDSYETDPVAVVNLASLLAWASQPYRNKKNV